jgi:hypothetical protein
MEISIELLIIMVKTMSFLPPMTDGMGLVFIPPKKMVMTFWGITDDILTLWDHQRKI